LRVPESLLDRPPATEKKEDFGRFSAAAYKVLSEMQHDSEKLTAAPHIIPARHLDDVRAAKQLDLAWKPAACMTDRNKPTGVKRLIRSFGYSFQGFRFAWREESAFRQEIALSAVVIPAGIYLGNTGVERALLVFPMLLILVVEFLNIAMAPSGILWRAWPKTWVRPPCY
jgi:hypothetical protein